MSLGADKDQLFALIEKRRSSINAYLQRVRPRARRLLLTSIISSALAAALTAGPALGGPRFTLSVADALGLEGGAAAVWRPLCLLAMIVSVIAAVSANLIKSGNTEVSIRSAETCNTELHLLRTFLTFDQVSFDEALKQYQQAVSKVPFILDEASSTD